MAGHQSSESGALFSYSGNPTDIVIRVGVSFVSTSQACANAENEIGASSFENVLAQAKALWQEKLSKIEIDIANTPPDVTEMLYSSLYRASLTPVSNAVEIDMTISNLYRTMQLGRVKEYSRTPAHTILILCTVGELLFIVKGLLGMV